MNSDEQKKNRKEIRIKGRRDEGGKNGEVNRFFHCYG